jgi:hypothetical protein
MGDLLAVWLRACDGLAVAFASHLSLDMSPQAAITHGAYMRALLWIHIHGLWIHKDTLHSVAGQRGLQRGFGRVRGKGLVSGRVFVRCPFTKVL